MAYSGVWPLICPMVMVPPVLAVPWEGTLPYRPVTPALLPPPLLPPPLLPLPPPSLPQAVAARATAPTTAPYARPRRARRGLGGDAALNSLFPLMVCTMVRPSSSPARPMARSTDVRNLDPARPAVSCDPCRTLLIAGGWRGWWW